MKTLKQYAFAALAIAMVFNFSSCNKDDSDDPPVNQDPLRDYTKIDEQNFHDDSYSVHLYMMEDPFVGYNRVAVRVLEAGSDNVAQNIDLEFRPMMDMGSMMHTTPVEQPAYDSEMNAYTGSATFAMPSTAGNWTFEVIGGPEAATPDTAAFSIEVVEKTEARLYSFNADSVTSYFVALKEPMMPEVGLNNFELMIYRRESMMSFPPATNLKTEIDPQMPAMGHGSPNNENPTHVADGLYAGKVNFTMSGFWKVHIKITDDQDTTLNEDGYFDITVQ